jgi:hypothetical protein
MIYSIFSRRTEIRESYWIFECGCSTLEIAEKDFNLPPEDYYMNRIELLILEEYKKDYNLTADTWEEANKCGFYNPAVPMKEKELITYGKIIERKLL